MSSKLSASEQGILKSHGFRFFGPCGCSTSGEDWKNKDNKWNVRLYYTINHMQIEQSGRIVDGGKITELNTKLSGFKDYITTGKAYSSRLPR